MVVPAGEGLVASSAHDQAFPGQPGLRRALPAGSTPTTGIAIEVTGEAKNADVTDSEPPGGSHAFRLELHEAVITAVEGDELVVRFWRPGLGVRTIRRK